LDQALAHAGLPQVLSPLATLVTGHLASPAHELQLEPQAEGNWVATAAGITTLIAAAGFAVAQIRSFALLMSFLSATPLWSKFDPIHVLENRERVKKRKLGDEEPAEKMFG
jgi:hypothetical protein